ncbi:MAG: L-ribulose-5-phosphate 4-epimerase AraD [Armatimonadetes bacterium]|nr:L-ribulose-5-phosphate 4-epimerase AraD [Armatimonadota bacterium]
MSDHSLDQLKEAVYAANMQLVRAGLVVLTWGNASGVDRGRGIVAIKPSGVAYDALRPKDIVLVSLETGEPLPGERLRPSSDTPTHVCLYQRFSGIGGIAHTHSRYATSWAQACREIPCYGTTHADTFHGVVPLCRPLTPEEINEGYEWNTGVAIVEHFAANDLDPLHVPGTLLPFHAPFAWGATPAQAVEHAIIVEEVAGLAWRTEQLNPQAVTTPQSIVDKHFLRKHGKDAYYGQPKT